MPISKGSDLVLLLLAGFRSLADAGQAELAARGFDDVRPVNGFAIRAVEAGADTASELGRRLTISKQAAAKIIVGLQERGYLERGTDPNDARRKRLQVTEHGFDMLTGNRHVGRSSKQLVFSRKKGRFLAESPRGRVIGAI